jgi:hypothetical protein
VETGIWLADDTRRQGPSLILNGALDDAARRRLNELLSPAACFGGRCNIGALLDALDWLQEVSGARALVWVHGPQPAPLGSGESLRMRFERGGGDLTLWAVQVDEGACRVTQALDGLNAVRTLPPVAAMRDAGAALGALFAEWRPDTVRLQVARRLLEPNAAPVGPQAAREVTALWAAEEVRRRLHGGQPVSQQQARELALDCHLVTPVSSAVVLESQQQFQDAGLEPVTPESVPTIPEPEFLVILLIAAAVLFATLWRRRRGKRVVHHGG